MWKTANSRRDGDLKADVVIHVSHSGSQADAKRRVGLTSPTLALYIAFIDMTSMKVT
jgi:hypothetical protein